MMHSGSSAGGAVQAADSRNGAATRDGSSPSSPTNYSTGMAQDISKEIIVRSIRVADTIRISYDGIELDFGNRPAGKAKMKEFRERIADAVKEFLS